MKKIVIILNLLISNFIIAQTSLQPNTEWIVASSSIKFKIKNAGFNVDGSFTGLTAKINFDENKSYGNTIEAVIEAKTIKTGIGKRDEHLKKDEYFGVDKFSKITIKSTAFGKEKDGSFKGFFKLTLKDKTKDVVIPFKFTETNGKATLIGEFTIDRLDFGVGEKSMVLANNALIKLEVTILKK